MPKQDIDPFAYMQPFMKLVQNPGALLSVIDYNDQPNAMTIGWCSLGIIWGKPICTVYVRPSRHTFTCLEQIRQFTVNTVPPDLARASQICGSTSGRDQDKFKAADLTPTPAKKVKPPIIQECIHHIECNVVNNNDIIPANLHRQIIDSYYPNGDFHRCYFGEIVACYADTDALEKLK